MHDLYLQLVAQARGAWRFRWYALLVAWIVAVCGWLVVYSLPNEYEATTRVYVDTDSLLTPLLKGLAIQPDMHTRVQLMTQTLLSRPNLEQVARDTGLYLRADSPQDMDALLLDLGGRVKLEGGGRHDLYTISYTDNDPQMAQKVVQSLLNVLMNNTFGSNMQNSSAAQNFLKRQIQDYRNRLTAAEQRLAEFKKDNLGLIPGQGGKDYFARLQGAEQQLTGLKDQLQTAESSRDSIQGQLKAMQNGTYSAAINPQVEQINRQIDAYNQKLNQMLLRYTDKYPDVVALKQMIAQLETQRTELQKSGSTGQPIDPTNPVYEGLQSKLYDTNVAIGTLKSQIARQQQRLSALKQKADKVTDIEARLTSLTRDYSVTKKQYQDLVSRLETAQMSQDASHSGNNLKFRIIDPPVVPLIPTGPKRLLFLSIVLVFSLATGGAFAIFLHQIRPVFLDRQALKEALGRPVLGVVSIAWTHAERRFLRTEVLSFVAGVLLLTLTFGGALLFNEQITHVVQSVLPGAWL
jgi:polysaccharide chain length determinant protein (PEP-CTERM system associated)